MTWVRRIVVVANVIAICLILSFAPKNKSTFSLWNKETPAAFDTAQRVWVAYKRTVYVNPNTRVPNVKGDMLTFMRAMARAESNNNPTIVNSSGHLGKYQFNIRTLRSLGIDVPVDSFLNNEYLQDSAMVLNIRRNYRTLRGVIREFDGTWVDGIKITTSGILAGAHLMGPGGVLSFFYPDQYGHDLADNNGTHITQYMSKFSNYRVSL